MVVIGTLSWNVNVEGAAEAKAQAQAMSTGMDDTAETATESAENLDELAASYMSLEHLMGDTSQQAEEQESSIAQTALAYVGLAEVLGMTTEEEEEQESQSSFLASGLFFLASMVGRLILQYTALGGILGTATKLFGGLARVVKWIAGLPLASWAATAGGAFKSGLLWVFRGLVSIGGTLLSWGSSFVSWLAAGSAGALAFAAAIGFVIGMIGVWILEITGVLDWIGKLGQALGTSLPGWARDGLLAVIGIFVGGLAVLGGLVIGFIEGGFSGAWNRAAQIVDIFFGSFKRTFNRIANWGSGLVSGFTQWWVDFKNNAISEVESFISTILTKAGDLGTDISKHITEGFKGIFNSVIPSRLEVPEITIGGFTIDAGPAGSYQLPSYTVGGQGFNMPQLEEGGMVEETGLAQVHEGETYIPRDVRQNMGGDGGTGETKNVTINVGGVEMGDQSLDLSRMGTTELRNLAEQIAEVLGTEADTIV
ncbi:tail tape measure protein [Haloarcula virus HVTV-2]|uniref:Tape measure n=1 Tax=Haloarcula vallismortis tailed virus 1 TaxID=1262528 RepID=L7TKJ0_9CAUD|nr:tail length tape measure protein [Haloarcula vallismortis tailed virus 1]AGC34500.1 tape measure [Haloarcula vallismortis tailed virus 1]UBF22939.1 tail tape measure protein [Haloarcula virus HVTV-2]